MKTRNNYVKKEKKYKMKRVKMEQKRPEMRKDRNHAKTALLAGILILLMLALTSVVMAADPANSGGKATTGIGRIGEFFSEKEYLEHSVMLDFAIFFLIFFSMCWLGFSK